jgi:hypothetical protein
MEKDRVSAKSLEAAGEEQYGYRAALGGVCLEKEADMACGHSGENSNPPQRVSSMVVSREHRDVCLVSGLLLGPIGAASMASGSRETSRERKYVLWAPGPGNVRVALTLNLSNKMQ